MEQNKTRKYLLYAIGEVFLVVIGILIALQVNNWNEDRNERQVERESLTQISEGLTKDIIYTDRLENRLENLLESIAGMKRKALLNEQFVDSLYLRDGDDGRWYLLRTGIVIQMNAGPYETLKNAGLSVIEDDSLRNELVNYFDFSAPRTKSLLEFYQDLYFVQVEDLISFLGEPFVTEVDGEPKIVAKFPSDMFTDPDFLILLRDMEDRGSSQLSILQRHREEMIALKALIDLELE